MAQTEKPKTVVKLFPKYKPPVVKSFLGRNENGATVTVEEAKQLISLSIKVTDGKNNVYAISSYQFMYKKKNTIENEETGKRVIAFTTVADLFKATPLPPIWIKNIAPSLQKDEDFYFFDIIVKDKLNHIFFAPDIKIFIK